jgi:hypothetical protein
LAFLQRLQLEIKNRKLAANVFRLSFNISAQGRILADEATLVRNKVGPIEQELTNEHSTQQNLVLEDAMHF